MSGLEFNCEKCNEHAQSVLENVNYRVGWTEFVLKGTDYTVEGALVGVTPTIAHASVYGGIYHRYCDTRQPAFSDLNRFVTKLIKGIDEGISCFDRIAERLIHE